MKPNSTGGPRRRPVSFDLNSTSKRSIWSIIAERPHIAVACVGTSALVGVAAAGIVMMLPSKPIASAVGQATAQVSSQPSIAAPAKAKTVDVATNATASQPAVTESRATARKSQALAPAQTSADTRPADIAAAPVDPAAASPKASTALVADTDPEPLTANDPRWTAKVRKPAGSAEKAGSGGETMAAFANGADEVRSTGAIDRSRPRWPITTGEEPTGDAVDGNAPSQDDSVSDTTGRPGKVYSGVNLRAKPGGRVLATVPARADIRVIACDQWCEIVYKGQHGYVYKSFLSGNAAPSPRRKSAQAATVAETAPAANANAAEISTPSAIKQPPKADINTVKLYGTTNR